MKSTVHSHLRYLKTWYTQLGYIKIHVNPDWIHLRIRLEIYSQNNLGVEFQPLWAIVRERVGHLCALAQGQFLEGCQWDPGAWSVVIFIFGFLGKEKAIYQCISPYLMLQCWDFASFSYNWHIFKANTSLCSNLKLMSAHMRGGGNWRLAGVQIRTATRIVQCVPSIVSSAGQSAHTCSHLSGLYKKRTSWERSVKPWSFANNNHSPGI